MNRENNVIREAVYRWRRIDGLTLEVLRLRVESASCRAYSSVVDASARPFSVAYEWELDREWRTRTLSVRVYEREIKTLSIERISDASWRVDGAAGGNLDGCDEIDLSISPFCNTLALRRFGPPPGDAGEITALYVSFPDLTCAPSRQRYHRLGPSTFSYIDLGVHKGFEARLTVDDEGFVREYEGLFQRVEPAAQ